MGERPGIVVDPAVAFRLGDDAAHCLGIDGAGREQPFEWSDIVGSGHVEAMNVGKVHMIPFGLSPYAGAGARKHRAIRLSDPPERARLRIAVVRKSVRHRGMLTTMATDSRSN